MQQWPCQVSPEKSPQLSPESRPSAPCWAAESPAAAGAAPAFVRDDLPVDLKTYGSAECGCSEGLKHADASGRELLLAQPQLVDQYAIAVGIARLQIVEQLAPPRHHPQQTAPRVMVLDVALEMIVEAVDARGQQRDLNLGRPGVAGSALMLGDDFRLVLNRDCHA